MNVSEGTRTPAPNLTPRSVTRDARASWRSGKASFAFPDDPSPEVSIIIPVRDHLTMTLECLRALHAHTEGSYEVMVVDSLRSVIALETDYRLEAFTSPADATLHPN